MKKLSLILLATSMTSSAVFAEDTQINCQAKLNRIIEHSKMIQRIDTKFLEHITIEGSSPQEIFYRKSLEVLEAQLEAYRSEMIEKCLK